MHKSAWISLAEGCQLRHTRRTGEEIMGCRTRGVQGSYGLPFDVPKCVSDKAAIPHCVLTPPYSMTELRSGLETRERRGKKKRGREVKIEEDCVSSATCCMALRVSHGGWCRTPYLHTDEFQLLCCPEICRHTPPHAQHERDATSSRTPTLKSTRFVLFFVLLLLFREHAQMRLHQNVIAFFEQRYALRQHLISVNKQTMHVHCCDSID